MSIDIATVERLMRRYWDTEKVKPEELRSVAVEILKLAKQGSSLEVFKSELGHMQVNRLRQTLDSRACEDIATRVFSAAHA